MYIGLVVCILVSYLLVKGYQNTQKLVVNEITIDTGDRGSKENALHILHISDMHLENISVTPDRLIESIGSHKIDIIALTGDFLDRKRSIPKLIPYLQALSKLQPVYGSFAVFGNHDYVLNESNFVKLKNVLNQYGFQTLQNENKQVELDGKQINIVGIDNYSTKHSDVKKAFTGINRGTNLVLTHDPNVVLTMNDYRFDYLLSGHFHGGQIHWPKPYHLRKMGQLVKMNMVKGLHQLKGRPFYISEGLGQTGFNIRIGSRPEITIHHFSVNKQIEKAM
ncbi:MULTISPECIES: metallophosphoesterase [Clostridia]|uniref:metallophosphoesterase n=1 Tax=Clostridia TaxID=186801 RepID=UPI0018F6BFA5|nr:MULTISPECIES: metallophosphoesterase [Clostridia]